MKITVDKAITWGHLLVNLPIFIILILGGWLVISAEEYGFFSLVLIFGVMWLWWSVAITYWRIWAFTNVRNVHELKRQAIAQKLIWGDGSWFEATEIRTRKQKKELKALDVKFLQPDEINIEEDAEIADEIKVYFSKGLMYLYIGMATIFCLFGFYELFKDFGSGIWGIVVGIYYFFFKVPKLLDNTPQMILNRKGIEMPNVRLIRWNRIKKVSVEEIGTGKYSKTFLVLHYSRRKKSRTKVKINISEFDLSSRKIEKYIKTYRQLSRKG